MYDLESINQFADHKNFVDLTKAGDRALLEAECKKLEYLTTYPSIVRSKIRAKKSEIKILNTELTIDINSQPSEILKIKRQQELVLRYKELEKHNELLHDLGQELIYAERIKLRANTRLAVYRNMLDGYKEGE